MLELYEKKEPAFVIAVREVPKKDVSKYGIIDMAG